MDSTSTNRITDRKREILLAAIEIIAVQGYSKLTLRAVARASGMKLGALQYHFPTREDMLRDLATFIGQEYKQAFERMTEGREPPTVRDAVELLSGKSSADHTLRANELFPQLWAMAQVEPVMRSLLDEIYGRYLKLLEERLEAAGSLSARAEALFIVSLMEGSTLFVAPGRRWERNAEALRDTVLASRLDQTRISAGARNLGLGPRTRADRAGVGDAAPRRQARPIR